MDTYFKGVPDLTDMSDTEIKEKQLETLPKYGIHTITVSEIYNGNLKTENIPTNTYHLSIEEVYQGNYGPVACYVYLLDGENNTVSILDEYNLQVSPSPQTIRKENNGSVYISKGFSGSPNLQEYTITLNINGQLITENVSMLPPG